MKNLYRTAFRHNWLFLFIGALSLALSAQGQTQPPLIQSQKVFTDLADYSTPAYIAKASDGKIGIITIGQNLKKFSATGDEMWTTSIPAQDAASGLKAQVTAGLAPTPDGGFTVLAYDKVGTYLTKFSANGTRVWAKKVVDDRSLSYLNLIATRDGGFLVTDVRPQQQINRGTYVTKFDQDGNLVWQTEVHYPYESSSKEVSSTIANAALSLTEGGYLLLGLTRTFVSNGVFGSWAAKLDSRGGVIWQKKYDVPILLDAGIESPFSVGSYIAAGYESLGNFNERTDVLTIQSDGTLSNTLYISNSRSSGSAGFKLSIVSAPPTASEISYTIFDTGIQRQSDFRLTNIGPNNQVRWTKFLGGSSAEIAQGIVTTDNGYAAIGLALSKDGDLSGQPISNQGTWLVNLALPPRFALQSPTYNCATGAFTFNTTGGDGSTITYRAPGITGPTTNPNQFVDAGLRQAADAKPISLSATQSGVTVTYVFDLRATCPIGTNPPVQTNNDRAILVDFYNSTNGPGWTNKTNWLQGDSPCNWFGVTCDGTGRVTQIGLSNNNLTGTLPASLGNLSQLTILGLLGNHIGGTIPASLGNLSNLKNLTLGSNNFSGEIPASLGNLSNLTYISVIYNSLSGPIPTSLGNLPNLLVLDLNYNSLNGPIPASFSNLSELQVLSLSHNLFNGAIPTSLGSLLKLQIIDLSYNQFTGTIPASLGSLPKLATLHLQSNQLSGCFPAELRALCGKSVLTSLNAGLPGGGDFDNFCSTGTGSCSPPSGSLLVLIQPTYNCTTGAFTFNTTGGNGSPITYRAPGITGPTTNPNQFVDAGLRQAADAKPISLSAIQSGVTVTYCSTCGPPARLGQIPLYKPMPIGQFWLTYTTPPTGRAGRTKPTGYRAIAPVTGLGNVQWKWTGSKT